MTSTIKAASRRMTALLAAILVVLGITTQTLVAKPVQAAFHQAYIQTTVDTSNWEILAGAVDVTSGFLLGSSPQEAQRMKNLLESLAACETPAAAVGHINTTTPAGTSSVNKNLILTFPGEIEHTSIIRHSSTDEDLARATLVRNSLIYDLNSAFKFVYGYDYQPSGSSAEDQLNTYWSDIKNFLGQVNGGSGSCNGCTISSCTSSDISKYPDSVTNYTDYIKITNSSTGESQIFQYRMLKGYVDGGGRTNVADTLGLRKGSASSDVAFIHWGHLAAEASVNYNSEESLAITADNVYNSTPTAFEKAVSSFFNMLANGISSVLGLWSFDELIFNAGVRGTSAYVGGIFPTTWQPLIWTFFFVFEIAAIVILLYAIIFNVGRRAMATMNPIVRANAIDQIQYLFLVALALGLLPIVLQLLINLNMNLTGIFTDALGDKTAVERFKNISASSGSLMSALTNIVYLGAVIYFNVFYLIRSLMVAFLIITGPIFIAMMGISETKRRLTIAWAKEMAANIFIQPLQAMMLAFILMVPSTARNIDSLVMAYAMIPLTNVLRGLFFGDSGGLVHQMAERGKQSGMKTLKKVGSVATTAGVGAVVGGAAAGKAAFGKSENANTNEENKKTEEQNSPSDNPSNKAGKTEVSKMGEGSSGSTEGTGEFVPESGNTGKIEPGVATGSTGFGSKLKEKWKAVDWDTVKAHPVKSAGSAIAGGAKKGFSTAKNVVTPIAKKGASTAGTVIAGTAAIGLGAIGGAQKNVVRRLFDINNSGAVATQLSRNMAGIANKRLHPVTDKTTEKSTHTAADPWWAEPVEEPKVMEQPVLNDINPESNNEKDIPNNVTDATENVFDRGYAKEIAIDKARNQYEVPTKKMSEVGVQAFSMEKGQVMVSYDRSHMFGSDAKRFDNALNIWENGTDMEKAALKESGIKEIMPQSEMIDGKKTVTGANIVFDSYSVGQSYGMHFGNNGLTMITDAGMKPHVFPDTAGYINQKEVTPQINSQVAEEMGVTIGTSKTLDSAIPQMTTFTAPNKENLRNFASQVQPLNQEEPTCVPVAIDGERQYQIAIPTKEYEAQIIQQPQTYKNAVDKNLLSPSQAYKDAIDKRPEGEKSPFTPGVTNPQPVFVRSEKEPSPRRGNRTEQNSKSKKSRSS